MNDSDVVDISPAPDGVVVVTDAFSAIDCASGASSGGSDSVSGVGILVPG